jgi:hypothetical protein
MKKFIALFVVAILFSLNAYAADSWTPASVTGTFQANVVCIPTLTVVDNDGVLGNYFAGSTALTLPATPGPGEDYDLLWNITGPAAAAYTIVFGDVTGGNFTETFYATTDGTSSIDGTWYLGGTAVTANLVDGSIPDIVCALNNAPIGISYVAETIVPGVAGTKSYIVTLTVSATI